MNKTKTIYFFSAVVLIIGCYALNLSYSLFVQTEDKEIVNATVPSLLYNLEQEEFLIKPNEKTIITLNINNAGNANINYGISLDGTNLNENIKIQLVDIDNNNITGNLKSNSEGFVKLYIENNQEIEQTLKFKLEATYDTLNFDTGKYISNTKIDTEDKYKLNLNENILLDNRINKTEENAQLYKTIDDYGETWYFKGEQNHNYISFANHIWRIVRINGDNTIRLILNDVLENKTVFNNDNTNDIGYMYGNTIDENGIIQYNTNNSTLKELVDKFYETNLKENFEEFLADALFCGENVNLDDITVLNLKCDEGIVENKNRYTSKFDETNTINNINLNNDLTYPIALLSEKELLLAEHKNQEENIVSYLNDLELDDNWWTMISTETGYNKELYIRPVINLKSNILIKSGNGTIDSPYEIELTEELSETLD